MIAALRRRLSQNDRDLDWNRLIAGLMGGPGGAAAPDETSDLPDTRDALFRRALADLLDPAVAWGFNGPRLQHPALGFKLTLENRWALGVKRRWIWLHIAAGGGYYENGPLHAEGGVRTGRILEVHFAWWQRWLLYPPLHFRARTRRRQIRRDERQAARAEAQRTRATRKGVPTGFFAR